MHSLRYIQAIQVATIASFFTLVAINNITDYDSGCRMVLHVAIICMEWAKNSRFIYQPYYVRHDFSEKWNA